MDVGLILAAGRSSRFGPENKLLAPLGGRPLVSHAADALAGVVARCFIVAADADVAEACPGAEWIAIDNASTGQSDSLRAGIEAVAAIEAARVLIVLGDMPFVTVEHLLAVLRAGDTAGSTDGTRRMPPACFPRAQFQHLLTLGGDRGAGALLRQLPEESLVRADPETLFDVDTGDALEQATLIYSNR